MIVARHFGGFEAFDRMSWVDVHLALAHLSEERIGTAARAEVAVEDAKFQQSLAALR